MKPVLILLSAPSGAGKSTLCDMLLSDYPEIVYSISCTTRTPRGEEEDGIDYHFLPKERFLELRDAGEFLEWAEVHGNFYGTLASPIRDAFAEGNAVIMDIDVKGAEQIRKNFKDGEMLDIFILPPSLEELRNRLESRGEDDEATIERRLANAQGEIDHADEFRFRVVNDDLHTAYHHLRDIIETFAS